MIDINEVLDDITNIKNYICEIIDGKHESTLCLEYLIGFLNRIDCLYNLINSLIVDEIDSDELMELFDNEGLEDFTEVIYTLNITSELHLADYI